MKINTAETFADIVDGLKSLKDDPEEFKQKMIKLGVKVGSVFLLNVVKEYLPKLKDWLKENKEEKNQEKQDIISKYEKILEELKYKNKNELSLTEEEYEKNLEEIAQLEKKIKNAKSNKTAKIAGGVAIALGTGGISLVAVALAKKLKKDKEKK